MDMDDQNVQAIANAVCSAVISAFRSETSGRDVHRTQSSSGSSSSTGSASGPHNFASSSSSGTGFGSSSSSGTGFGSSSSSGSSTSRCNVPHLRNTEPSKILPSFLRKRRQTGKVKSWNKDIVCLPLSYKKSGTIPIPRQIERQELAKNGLIGKIHLFSTMSEEEVRTEIRSVFAKPMRFKEDFKFSFLRSSGTKILTKPSVSAHFQWTPQQVATLGQGAIYVLAEEEMDLESSDEDPDMEPPPNKLAKLKQVSSDQDEDYDPGFDEDIEAAIKASLDDQISEISFDTIVGKIKSGLRKHQELDIVVKRESILECAFKISYKFSYMTPGSLSVEFIDEAGVDTGGLLREFFMLLFRQIQETYIENGTFRHDSVALQDGTYDKIGMYVSLAIVHGGEGCGCHFFNKYVFDYICCQDISSMCISCADYMFVDKSAKDLCELIDNTNDDSTLQSVLLGNSDILIESGVTQPLTKLTVDNKSGLIKSIILHYIILKQKAELDQFCHGLDYLQVLQNVKENKDIFLGFFINELSVLTPSMVRKLFHVNYITSDSIEREKQQNTYLYFVDFLEECYEGITMKHGISKVITLHTVLAFLSGSEEIPPLGYTFTPEIFFTDMSPYPTVSTCTMELTLPSRFTAYDDFKESIITAIISNDGFGRA